MRLWLCRGVGQMGRIYLLQLTCGQGTTLWVAAFAARYARIAAKLMDPAHVSPVSLVSLHGSCICQETHQANA